MLKSLKAIAVSFIMAAPIQIRAAAVALSIGTPATVWAGQQVGKFGLEELINDSVVFAVLAFFSLMGGIASTGIKTDADEFVTHPRFYKVFCGLFVGFVVSLGVYKGYNISIYMVVGLAFMVATLGSAILVFYMQYFSDPATRKALKERIDELARLKRKGGA